MKNIITLIALILPYFLFSQSLDYRIDQALKQIRQDDGVVVVLKNKGLSKFGYNPDVSTSRETVWVTGGDETYATGNDIDRVSSSNNGDNQIVVIEGHTIDGNGDLTFIVQSVTLTGQTPATLSTPLYRSTRLYNNGSTNFAGTIYVFESGGTVTAGVPQVTADIHVTAESGANQSQKASTSLSSVDYWIITKAEVSVGVSSGNARNADFDLEVRESGKVFRRVHPFSAANNGASQIVIFDPAIVVKPNSDVRITAVASGAGTQAKAVISGHLAIIIQ